MTKLTNINEHYAMHCANVASIIANGGDENDIDLYLKTVGAASTEADPGNNAPGRITLPHRPQQNQDEGHVS